MKIIFLDFDGVISTYEKGWRFDVEKIKLLKEIVDKTDAKIVVTSSWKRGFTEVDNFIKSFYDKPRNKDLKNITIFDWFANSIYDITDNNGSWRGDEIQRWIDKHNEEIESYVILDDDSDFRDNQLFNFVQTDTYEGITSREVKLCIKILNGERIPS
jgi:succinate dehydrogenase flavin-adding protein (antitoxin of CptAB toxin-antitoxin module)